MIAANYSVSKKVAPSISQQCQLFSPVWQNKLTTVSAFLNPRTVSDFYCSLYTVNHKKGGSTFVIITLENLDGF